MQIYIGACLLPAAGRERRGGGGGGGKAASFTATAAAAAGHRRRRRRRSSWACVSWTGCQWHCPAAAAAAQLPHTWLNRCIHLYVYARAKSKLLRPAAYFPSTSAPTYVSPSSLPSMCQLAANTSCLSSPLLLSPFPPARIVRTAYLYAFCNFASSLIRISFKAV